MLSLIFLKPLDQNECLIPHLKDLVHIFLEPEAKEVGMNLRTLYAHLIYP